MRDVWVMAALVFGAALGCGSGGSGGSGGGGGGASASSAAGGAGSAATSGSSSAASTGSSSAASTGASSSSGSGSASSSGSGGPSAPPIVFQCAGIAGGICTMNADGTGRVTLLATGRVPDMNAASEVLFHDDAYTVQKLVPNQMPTSLGPGASARWTPDGHIVFQCSGLNGGICTMNADGTGRKTLLATGRSPDMNAASEVLFHDDAYTVQKLVPNQMPTSLGAGAFARWTPDGHIVFQCNGLNGGICTMNADGTGRKTLLATGRVPDMNAASEVLFHDDAYTVQKLAPNQMPTALGAGAFGRWTP